jgi:cell division protein FtsB
MWTQQKKRSQIDALIVPVICLTVSAYFLHHSFDGRFGSEARTRIDAERVAASARLDALKAERIRLEHKVALLRSGTIERDTLDEHARSLLGMIGSKDAVIAIGG